MSILEVKGLHKSFADNHVLRGIDFSLEEGGVLSIIGSSGSGKTTLLRCLTALETADSGSITVAGKKIFDADDKTRKSGKEKLEYQKYFGLVFQSFNLFPQYNVMQNMTLAPLLHAKTDPANKGADKSKITAEINERAEKILETVGLSDKKENYPCELSGGQQQRVAIARALMLSPKILCFDEPTSALDPELTGEVLRVIKGLCNLGITMVIVTHEMSFARDISSEVIFMNEGVIAEQGSPAEVFGNPRNERLKEFLRSVNT